VWNGIVSSFKKYPYTLPRTGRLTNEEIKLYLLPTADLYRAGAFNPSPLSTDHPYVDYMVEITWKDATGKMRSESITTRRSQ
jgi:hypothetical protein